MTVLFYICAALAVLAALNVVLQRTPVYSALSLIVVLCALALVYLLLGAEFMAVIQVVVYGGAIWSCSFSSSCSLMLAKKPRDHEAEWPGGWACPS